MTSSLSDPTHSSNRRSTVRTGKTGLESWLWWEGARRGWRTRTVFVVNVVVETAFVSCLGAGGFLAALLALQLLRGRGILGLSSLARAPLDYRGLVWRNKYSGLASGVRLATRTESEKLLTRAAVFPPAHNMRADGNGHVGLTAAAVKYGGRILNY